MSLYEERPAKANGKSRQIQERLLAMGGALDDGWGEDVLLDPRVIQCDSDAYQRTYISEETIAKIAKNFSKKAFGRVLIARRRDALGTVSYWAIDGWHRTRAAIVIGLPVVACTIHDFSSVKGEAKACVQTNVDRTSMTAVDKFKNKCASGDAKAIALRNLIENEGYRLDRDHGTDHVTCIRAFENSFATNADALRLVWQNQLADLCRGQTVRECLVVGLWHLAVKTNGESLKPEWTKQIMKLGYEVLIDACDRRAHIDRDSPKVLRNAMAIAAKVNYGKQKKLKLTAR